MALQTQEIKRHSKLLAPRPAQIASSSSNHGLKSGVLSPLETLGQSIAGIAPSATPGMLIPIVFGFAGNGTWLAYVVATIGIIFTAKCINEFTSRSACPGSLYSFVNQELGLKAGMLTGWALMFAYIFCGAACATEVALYISAVTNHFFHLELNNQVLMISATVLVAYIACKNIKMSASIMLRLEFVSIGLILLLAAITLAQFGFKPDLPQINLEGVRFDNVRMGLVMAIFGFVAFESSASLAVEAKEPLKTIPRAIILSVVFSGLFFVITSYALVLSFHGSSLPLNKCSTPLLSLATNIGMPFLGHLVDIGVMISFFAASLANLNAASRVILKMSKDGIFPQVLSQTHKNNCTPHIAIMVASALSLSIALGLSLLNCPLLDIVGWLGSLGTFGFIFGYLATSLSAGKLLKRLNKLSPLKLFIVGASLFTLTASLFGSVYPAPEYPYSLLPYIFAAYMFIGLLCSMKLKATDQELLS